MVVIPNGLSDTALEDLLLGGARAMPRAGAPICNDSAPRCQALVPARRCEALQGLMDCAAELLRRRSLKSLLGSNCMSSPAAVRDYLHAHFTGYEHEAFVVLFLNGNHDVIAVEEMFRGTLTQTSVYPREIVKRALARNAGAVIFAHNHPSNSVEPSRADEYLTQTLKHALGMVDVRVLDHMVVGSDRMTSMAERGLV